MLDFNTFADKGLGGAAPSGCKKIRYQIIYDVKQEGHHMAHLVAGSHLTYSSTESVYSGVVSLQGIRLIIFLAKLGKVELWGADVGNASLEALTKEKVYIIAGPELGDLASHTLLIFKALYDLGYAGISALLMYFE
jgi:hypothetical protein